MKKMKKALALLLIAAMAMSLLSVSIFAADTYSIEIVANDGSGLTAGHEYSVYQLFVGDLSGGVLSNIKYGTAGVGTAGDPVPAATLAAITDAEKYADSLNIASLTPYGTLNEANNWGLTGENEVPAGYYLIVDDTSKTLTDGDGYSSYIVQVVKDVKMAPKSEKVTSDKTEKNDAVQDVNVNEGGVGSVISYTLTAKIADNAASYDYYNFILKDKLSTGLTFNNDINVTIGGVAADKACYAVYTGTDAGDYTFKVALLDATAHPGATVVVTYSATVNSAAKTMIPEENRFIVTYSNNPEHEYVNDKSDDKPGLPKDDRTDVFGDTPEKKTKTYETELVLTKEDPDGKKLKGATFKLTSANANQTVLDTKEYYELDPNGTYYLLKDGTYTETAPTGTEYVKIGTGDSKTTVGYILKDGAYVVPTDVKEYVDQDLYMLVLGTESKYASLNKYAKKTATETASVAAPVEVILTTGEDGVLNFTGLGTGTYTLKEVDAPDGFNYIDDVTFTIEFSVVDAEQGTGTFTVTNVSGATITNNNGKFATTVVDQKGNTLPETGGMGTTLFYVFGAILVLGAGVLLVTRKRMAHE